MEKLLFVCSGNVYRSPFAAKLARNYMAQHGVEAEIRSVGLAKADPKLGTKQIDRGLVLWADKAVFGMDSEITDEIANLYATTQDDRRKLYNLEVHDGYRPWIHDEIDKNTSPSEALEYFHKSIADKKLQFGSDLYSLILIAKLDQFMRGDLKPYSSK